MATHTAGPWYVADSYVVEAETDEGTVVVANTRAPETTPYDECRANARLIAATPKLLAAARSAVAALTQPKVHQADIDLALKNLNEAIAEAEPATSPPEAT